MSRGTTPPADRRPVTRHRAVALALVLSTAVLAATVVPPRPAVATSLVGDDVPFDGGAVHVRLHDLVAVVGPATATTGLPEEERAALPPPDVTARVLIENRSSQALADARFVVELEGPVSSRSQLRERLDDAPDDPRFVSTQVLVDERIEPIGPGDVAQRDLVLDGDTITFTPGPGSAAVAAVRPLSIAVVRGVAVLDEVRTGIVGLAAAPTRPLETAVVLPVDHQPRSSPRAATAAAAAAATSDDDAPATPTALGPPVPALAAGGRVDRLTTAIEAVPSGAVSFAPAAHTLEALVDGGLTTRGSPELFERLRAVAAADERTVVSSAFALADVPTLASSTATAALASVAVADGRRRLGQALGSVPGSAHLALVPQTPASLDLVPGDLLVTRWDDAAGVDLEADPSAAPPPPVRTAVAPSGRSLRVLVADPWLTRALEEATGAHGPAVDAHRLVLETAAMWAEDPETGGRAVALVPPVAWPAAGTLATELTTRLAASPWLRLADPSTVVQRADQAAAGWAPQPSPRGDLSEALPVIATVARRFDALSSSIDPTGDRPAVFGERDALLVAATTWPTASPAARARAVVGELDDALDGVQGSVVVPNDTTVTLTSEEGVVPVTVRRDEGPPLDVVVEVRPQGRLELSGASTRQLRLTTDGAATVGFETRALGTGTFPLSVTVRTLDGDITLATALISVRATAVSRPALGGIAVVLLMLLLIGRRRRARDERPTLEVVR